MGLARTPIIGMSAMFQDHERVFQSQIDDILCKPIGIKNLSSKILHYGRLGRSAGGNDLPQFMASISSHARGPRRTARNFDAKL